MFDPFGQWSRYLSAGHSMHATGRHAAETLDGASRVVAARSAIIGEALVSPWTADHAELGRMIPEKMEAFALAGSAIATVWWDNGSLWMKYLQHLGVMAMRGRPPTVAELADLGQRSAVLALRSVGAGARLGSASLAPVRGQVRANVRRLKVAERKPRRTGRSRAR
ncbi:hypothetical protein [Sphingopyxis sp.]|uniref:hypothetical protein n=1 Tax=Sphingopyxis sp. TaxID=1908224 RepID=UPI002ED7C5C7